MIKSFTRALFSLVGILLAIHTCAQYVNEISLDSCLIWAEDNYPQVVQFDLLNKSTQYNLENASKGKLPRISIQGQATYQSDVTSLPGGEAMGVPQVSKDQYNFNGEVVQPITDLAIISQNKKIIKAQGEIDQINVAVSLYQIKERVSDMYFGILLTREQLGQSALAIADINAGIENAEASVTFGTALKSTVNILKAELLGLEQRVIEQESILLSYLQMLGRFIHKDLAKDTRLLMPQTVTLSQEITRPELQLFDTRIHAITLQSELVRKNNLPNFSLFFRGGVGRPALNLLNNDFEMYYLGGLKLAWNLSNFYTSRNKQQVYSLNLGIVQSERETFLFNTKLSMTRQSNEIDKVKQMLAKDQDILKLREQVVNTAKGQLENGVITANDYKTVVTDADLARQNLTLHEIELLRLQNQYKLTTGK